MHECCRFVELRRQCTGHQKDGCVAGGVDKLQPWIAPQEFGVTGRSRITALEDEDRDRGGRREAAHHVHHCHDSAPSRHAYSTPTSRMTMNISISMSAVTPSCTYTTAHGYMKTISMSKARNSTAIV